MQHFAVLVVYKDFHLPHLVFLLEREIDSLGGLLLTLIHTRWEITRMIFLRCILHLKRLGRKILLLYMILHLIYLHILVMIPHSQVVDIGY